MELQDYIIERAQWQPATFNIIQWPSFALFYQKQSSRKQTRISKYVHDWQNVGLQKIKIDHKTTEELCPMGCGCPETPMHCCYCGDLAYEGVRQDHLTQFDKYLDQIQTSPQIKQHIVSCISYWINSQTEYPISVERDSEGNQDLLSTTVEQQNEIGWGHFLKGRLSYNWLNLQDQYCQNKGIEQKYHGFQ